MNYVILEKAKPYTRTRCGKFENVRGYASKQRQEGYVEYHGTSAKSIYRILFEGIKPQNYHNFAPDHFKGARAKRVFVTGEFSTAKLFASVAEKKHHSPGIVLKVIIPDSIWEVKARLDNRLTEAGYVNCFMLPEVKPEWIVDAFDTDGKVMTKTIDSLRLKKFEKAGKLIYIPVSLGVLKKIFKKEQD